MGVRKIGLGWPFSSRRASRKAGVGVLVVALEIEAVLDQRGAGEGVVADAVATDPGIQQRERKKEENKKPALLFTDARRARCVPLRILH